MVEPLFFSSKLTGLQVGQKFNLDGEEGKHAATVRRMKPREAIQLSDGNGIRVKGFVSAVESNSVLIEIASIASDAEPELRITLVQALAKGDRDELAIQAGTELGILEVIPWQANRSVSKWEGSKIAKSVDRWQSIVSEASKQSLRTFIPKVEQPKTSKELSYLFQKFDEVLILDPLAAVSLTEVNLDKGKIALVVGPEGGIDSSEMALFETAGGKRVHMGSGILRTSTAGLAAIAFIQGKTGAWNIAE